MAVSSLKDNVWTQYSGFKYIIGRASDEPNINQIEKWNPMLLAYYDDFPLKNVTLTDG